MSNNPITDHETDHRSQTIKRVLARLWEIANLSHEVTRNSVTGQVKALTMIVAIESLVPDRRDTARKRMARSLGETRPLS